VPFHNQPLIRTSLPTSHGYQYASRDDKTTPPEDTGGKTPFVHLFEFVATIDYSPYLCVPAALQFRDKLCGGEEAVRRYCFDIVRKGGARLAEILGTDVMGVEVCGSSRMTECCFANVSLPLRFHESQDQEGGAETERRSQTERSIPLHEASKIQKWLNATAVRECDTYLQIAMHAHRLWVRLSGQIYLEVADFERVAYQLKELCARVERGEGSG
jgi:hypothetical protein